MRAERFQARLIRIAARTARDEAVALRVKASRLPAPLAGTLRELELLAEADAAMLRADRLERDADALSEAAAVRDRTDVISLG